MKRTIRPLLLAAAAVAALTLAACSSGGANEASVVGTWATPDAQGEPSLTFEEDGSYSGTDGCNRVGGQWSADGSTIDLGNMVSTMMYCEGVDTWLVNAGSAELSGDTLTFSDRDGAEIGTLTR